MFFNLAVFDWRFIAVKKSFVAMLLFFTGLGLLVAVGANFPFPDTFKNSPYIISYVTGLMSLVCIIAVSIIAAQSLFRERDANFDQVLYATAVNKNVYLGSRLLMIFVVTTILFTMLVAGLLSGQLFFQKHHEDYTFFNTWFYIQPLLVLAIPNILLSVAVICGIGTITRNRMLVYIAGIILYFAYWGISIFANSPLVAGSSPASAAAMQKMAILDPFGLAAFFEQTKSWTAYQRNTQVLQLSGNFLLNRVLYFALSMLLLTVSYNRFRFRISNSGGRRGRSHTGNDSPVGVAGLTGEDSPVNGAALTGRDSPVNGAGLTGRDIPGADRSTMSKMMCGASMKMTAPGITGNEIGNSLVQTNPPTHASGIAYKLAGWRSFVRIDLRYLFKSAPLYVILIGWMLFLGIELYGDLSAGTRFPAKIAGTTAITAGMLKLLPIVGLLMILFFGSELAWRSEDAGFDALEKTTPVDQVTKSLAKWFSLSMIPVSLVIASILVGCTLQLLRGDAPINISIYSSIFFLVAYPLILSCGLVICIHRLVRRKYLALAISTIMLLITNTSLGDMVAIRHPLLQFAKSFDGSLSEMNGYDFFIHAFTVKMIYWTCITLIIFIVTIAIERYRGVRDRLYPGASLAALFAVVAGITGYMIYHGTNSISRNEYNDWQQRYENSYKKFQPMARPLISSVETDIDLYPSQNRYEVRGRYSIINKSTAAIDSVLLNLGRDLDWDTVAISGAVMISNEMEYGHQWYRFVKPLQPGDSLAMQFSFRYEPSGFSGFGRFNNILTNGTFLRISNFFPRFGYNDEQEISNPDERKRRGMAASTAVPLLKQSAGMDIPGDHQPYEYGFINLKTTISTDADQQVVAVGQLVKTWGTNTRNYFRFETGEPIPFLFAVSSADYAVRSVRQGATEIRVYYHPGHERNVDHILKQAVASLAYFEKNFGPYPYLSANFAEISSFTNGFAATAYPGTFFLNESFGFTHRFDQDSMSIKEKDIINEQVSHELSHTWWGNATIAPVYQQGSAVLTETLAMYSELMAYKQHYGEADLEKRVMVHQDLYLSQRVFEKEPPLYLADPGQAFLNYDKGMVVMYRLYKLIGEERVNKALRLLLERYAYPKHPPTTIDLVRLFKEVVGEEMEKEIEDLFMCN